MSDVIRMALVFAVAIVTTAGVLLAALAGGVWLHNRERQRR